MTSSRSRVLSARGARRVILAAVSVSLGLLPLSASAEEGGGGEEDALDGGEVVVVEERRTQVSALPGATLTVISPGEGRARGLDMADILRAAPGVTVRRTGGTGSPAFARLRGAGAGQVRILVDGIPVSQDAAGGADLSTLPMDSVERIEVHRGILPLGLGAEGIGGAVNLVTRSGDGPPGVRGRVAAGSFGALEGSGAGVAAPGRWRLAITGSGRRSENDFSFYDDNGTPYTLEDDEPDAIRQNADTWGGELAVRGRRLGGGGNEVHLSAVGVGRGGGVPGPAASQATEARHGVGRATISARLGDEGMGGSQAGATWQGGRQWFQDPAKEVGLGTSDQEIDTAALSLDGVGVLDAGPLTLAGAAMGGRERWAWLGDPAALASRWRDRLAGSADIQGKWGRLAVGFRGSADLARSGADGSLPHTLAADPAEDLVVLWSPTGGLAVELTETATVRASGGVSHRLPSFPELYGDPAGLAPSEGLRPERAVSADLGLDLAHSASSETALLAVTGFWRDVRDQVAYVQNSQFTLRAENFELMRFWGLEAQAGHRRGAGRLGELDLQIAYTFTATRNLSSDSVSSGKALPGQPTHSLHGDLALGTRAIRAGAALDADEGNYLDAANLRAVPPRMFLHLRLEARPWARGPQYTIEVRNVTDHRVEPLDGLLALETGAPAPAAVCDYWGHPLPGRAFFLSATWSTWRSGS